MKIAVISDIHEDYTSLIEALQAISTFNCQSIICLGDISGFNPFSFSYFATRSASKSLHEIQQQCSLIVKGNHDLYTIRKAPQHTAGFEYPETWYELDYNQRKKLAKGKLWLYEDKELSALLSKQDMQYLENLPEYAILNTDKGKILFSHSVFPDLTGSTTHFPKTKHDFESHFGFMDEHECELSFVGHSHINGFMHVRPNKCKEKPFGQYKLKNKKQCILVPCIAHNYESASGFIVYDTDALTLEVIQLKQRIRNSKP